MKNAFSNLQAHLMVIEKSGGNNFWSYVPKDFAEKGILEISQVACAVEPKKAGLVSGPPIFLPAASPLRFWLQVALG